MRPLNKSRQAYDSEPQVNITPLIDVVFVILIMFIVIAPLLELNEVDLADSGGTEAAASVRESSPIVIHVRKDNSIELNSQLVSVEDLAVRLNQLRHLHPDARPQLFHDKRAAFGTYQSVKNAAETAGFMQLDILLKPS